MELITFTFSNNMTNYLNTFMCMHGLQASINLWDKLGLLNGYSFVKTNWYFIW